MFEVREGTGVAIVTQKEYQNPPLTFEAREGWGWLLSPRKKYQNPCSHLK
jgi:hypothetical protein